MRNYRWAWLQAMSVQRAGWRAPIRYWALCWISPAGTITAFPSILMCIGRCCGITTKTTKPTSSAPMVPRSAMRSEWARLACHALAMNQKYGVDAGEHYARDAYGLFRQSLGNWHGDGAAGFVYTTDFQGVPIVRERMHWVLCESIGAAVALDGVNAADAPVGIWVWPKLMWQTGLGGEFSYWYEQFIAYADRYLIEAPGRWHHQLEH